MRSRCCPGGLPSASRIPALLPRPSRLLCFHLLSSRPLTSRSCQLLSMMLLTVLGVLLSGCSSERPDAQDGSDRTAEAPAEEPLYDPSLVAAGRQVYEQKCARCHKLTDADGRALGPSFEKTLTTLPGRLATATYEAHLADLKARHPEHHAAYEKYYQAILAEPDLDRRLALWLRTYTPRPRFENPASAMAPVPGLSEMDVEAVIAYMLSLR